MRVLRSPWPLGVVIVVLSVLQYLTLPRYDEEILRLTGDALEDPAGVGAFVTAMSAGLVLVSAGSLLWLVFWKYPPEVRLFAWCPERLGQSLLWSLLFGASAVWDLWSVPTDLAASQYLIAACDVAWAVCMVLLRAVVVSRLAQKPLR